MPEKRGPVMTVSEAMEYWSIVTGRRTAPPLFASSYQRTLDAVEVAQAAALKAGPGTWRGRCGHVWDRPRGDAGDADCPLCALLRRVRELQGGQDAPQ
jgi:hypothetical protein